MKNIFALLIFSILALSSCEVPVIEPIPLSEYYADDPRLTSISGAEDARWIAYPREAYASRDAGMPRVVVPGNGQAKGINRNPHVIEMCVDPGVGYIFYDDEAVIAFEPHPDDGGMMSRAVAITVELHNIDNPGNEWGYINVAPLSTPPVTDNDPILGQWQFCLCLDDGTIVDGPYTAEFDFNWTAFKASAAQYQLEIYNRDNDPDAHIVWGTE